MSDNSLYDRDAIEDILRKHHVTFATVIASEIVAFLSTDALRQAYIQGCRDEYGEPVLSEATLARWDRDASLRYPNTSEPKKIRCRRDSEYCDCDSCKEARGET